MFFRRVFFLAACVVVSACATKPRTEPVVSKVCVNFGKMPEEEAGYLKRKATVYLKEQGFILVDAGCEAETRFTTLGQFQAEVLGGWLNRSSGYWSMEGFVTATHGSKQVLDDYPVDLRRYGTKQELLDALAWQTVRPVTWLFQPPPQAK